MPMQEPGPAAVKVRVVHTGQEGGGNDIGAAFGNDGGGLVAQIGAMFGAQVGVGADQDGLVAFGGQEAGQGGGVLRQGGHFRQGAVNAGKKAKIMGIMASQNAGYTGIGPGTTGLIAV